YDPAFITPLSVTPAPTLPSIMQAAKFENNKITFAYGVALEAGAGLPGSGTLATIKVKVLKEGNPSLTWTDKTLVGTVEATGNALKSASNATFTIASAQASANPSSQASANPSTQASIQPSADPSI